MASLSLQIKATERNLGLKKQKQNGKMLKSGAHNWNPITWYIEGRRIKVRESLNYITGFEASPDY